MFLNFLLMLTLSANADAEAAKFTILGKNQCAPFEGVLLDKYAIADVLSEYDISKYACDSKIKYELGLAEERHKLELKTLKIEHEALTQEYDLFIEQKDKEIQSLVKSLRKTSPRNKWLWFAGGIIIGTAGTYGAYKAFNEER